MELKEILELRTKVADLRLVVSLSTKMINEALAKLEDLEEWKVYQSHCANLSGARKRLKELEDALRLEATKYAMLQQNGAIADGISAKKWAEISIVDEDAVYRWLIDNARYVIPINESKLKRLAQSEQIPGLEIIKVYRASIAGDLSAYETPAKPEEAPIDESGDV